MHWGPLERGTAPSVLTECPQWPGVGEQKKKGHHGALWRWFGLHRLLAAQDRLLKMLMNLLFQNRKNFALTYCMWFKTTKQWLFYFGPFKYPLRSPAQWFLALPLREQLFVISKPCQEPCQEPLINVFVDVCRLSFCSLLIWCHCRISRRRSDWHPVPPLSYFRRLLWTVRLAWHHWHLSFSLPTRKTTERQSFEDHAPFSELNLFD